MGIREVSSLSRFERIGAHSHIKGLGLRDGKALPVADGLVGQVEAREAAGIVVELIRQGRMAGRAVLLAGPPGTGKTAIAIAIARELGEDTPFIAISGSEIYSAELKKTEVLMQSMRKAIGVRVREFRRVYEGVVKRLEVRFDRHPYNPWQQVPVGANITLKTTDEERTFSVDSQITMELLSKGVEEGDVVWIDAETGRVHKIGRAEEGGRKYDIGVAGLVQVPKGPISKEKEFVHTMTLHDLDVMQSRSGSLISLFFGGGLEKEISPEVRQRVDETVKKWVDEGHADIIPGVMFIDDVHVMDIEAFSFLTRALESELSPILILATNRGFTRIRGTDIESPHGIPRDLLDRLLIIKTRPYKEDEIREILRIRAREEKVELADDALEYLTKLGVENSLRYATQLLAPSRIVAERRGLSKITRDVVEEVRERFISMRESAEYLRSLEEQFLK